MKNIKLILQYDGTCYHGFQVQPKDVTVQGTIEAAFRKVTGCVIKINGCSRTDAGVHAFHYCANFEWDCSMPTEKIPLVINSFLPRDIRILSAKEVAPDFHARFDTKAKKYIYTINTAQDAGVFTKNYEWQLRKCLDIQKMQQAAAFFLGRHDFKAFMAAGSPIKDTTREIYMLEVSENTGLYKIAVTANGFLYNMVRIIAGTLVSVGEGKISPFDIPNIIAAEDRRLAGPTAPPQGLSLYEIYY